MYLCTPSNIQKISFTLMFILINVIRKFILIYYFELLWTRLTTSTWDDWINLSLLLIPYQKTDFITQPILEIKLTHFSSSLWTCPGMPEHTHWKQPTNICCFYGILAASKNSTSNLNVFCDIVVYLILYFDCLVLRFLDHNSWTRFFSNMLFFKELKDHWHF